MTHRMPQKSMTGIFTDLAQNRRETKAAAHTFVVVSLTKQGTPARVDASDLQWNATATLAQAQVRKAEMERLNPGKTFRILPLALQPTTR